MEVPQLVQLVLEVFAALVGWPAFLAVVINLLKYFKVLDDGLAPKVNFWCNLVAFVGVGVAVFTGHLDILGTVDVVLVGVAKILVELLAILTGGLGAMAMTKVWHVGLRGLPAVGYQHPKG